MNGIEKQLDQEIDVIRLNLWSQSGKRIAKQYGVNSAGTTLLLDATGEVIYRHVGMPDRKAIIELVESQAASG